MLISENSYSFYLISSNGKRNIMNYLHFNEYWMKYSTIKQVFCLECQKYSLEKCFICVEGMQLQSAREFSIFSLLSNSFFSLVWNGHKIKIWEVSSFNSQQKILIVISLRKLQLSNCNNCICLSKCSE